MKKHLTIAVLLLATLSLQAQQVTFWQKVHNFLNKAGDIDTTRIYYPQADFTLGLFATGQKSGLDLDVSFVTDLGEEGMLTGETQYNISESLCKKIGLEVGYGRVSLGYGIEVGPRSASKKSALAFNILGRVWGAHLNYYKITNPFNSGVTIGNEAEGYYVHDEFISSESAVLRSLMVDGYYVFNNKRFAYPAAGLTLGRFYFSTQFTFNDFYFRRRDALNSGQVKIPGYVDKLDYQGLFHDWMLKGLLVYKF